MEHFKQHQLLVMSHSLSFNGWSTDYNGINVSDLLVSGEEISIREENSNPLMEIITGRNARRVGVSDEGQQPLKSPNLPCKDSSHQHVPEIDEIPMTMGEEQRWISFRIKSAFEILDDGYKWRKYGKKILQKSPNPRNYFRCANQECCVKKRVEKDPDDGSYVLTSYQGKHNHQAPYPAINLYRAFESQSTFNASPSWSN